MRLDVHAHLWSTEYLDLLQAHGVHEVAAYRHLGAGLNVKDFAIAGVDGVSDAIHAVQAGEMVSILQDAKGQMQGSIDVALRAVKGESYQPQSDIWKQYAKDLKWEGGTQKHYYIPWAVVTAENAQALLDARK
ncbi:hypothetical protein FB6_4663 [Serratia marcescens]|nr:hypothetical protein SMKC004_20920 [Serratia marcescens]CAB1227521.1 hypothetical protein FB6_4663 [Serratia marcescens]